MKIQGILILIHLYIAVKFSDCIGNGDCEDVTVGDCTINPEDIIQEVDIFTDIVDCQYYCNGMVNCQVFRFDGQLCSLITKDYRKDCILVGAPFDKSINDCLKINHEETCDLYIEEDCLYTGKILLVTPPGSVADKKRCEDYCTQFHYLDCQYWVYDNYNKLCALFESKDRNCASWGGPRDPSLSDCVGSTTLTTPLTTVTTSKSPDTTTSTTLPETSTSTTTQVTTTPTTLPVTTTVPTDTTPQTTMTSTTIEKDLSGCSAVSASTCKSEESVIIEEVEGIESTEYCQFICNTIYAGTCTYFSYNLKSTVCTVIYRQEIGVCSRMHAGTLSDINECDPIFDDEVYEHTCYNFREHLCSYTGYVFANLENLPDVNGCQMACRSDSICKFFVYDVESKDCELLDSDKRECDMIRGTPNPDFEQCKKDGHIHWP